MQVAQHSQQLADTVTGGVFFLFVITWCSIYLLAASDGSMGGAVQHSTVQFAHVLHMCCFVAAASELNSLLLRLPLLLSTIVRLSWMTGCASAKIGQRGKIGSAARNQHQHVAAAAQQQKATPVLWRCATLAGSAQQHHQASLREQHQSGQLARVEHGAGAAALRTGTAGAPRSHGTGEEATVDGTGRAGIGSGLLLVALAGQVEAGELSGPGWAAGRSAAV